jgi:hypothetical protein
MKNKIECVEVDHSKEICIQNDNYKNISTNINGFPTILLYTKYKKNINYNDNDINEKEIKKNNLYEYNGNRIC